jgi:hypothetical protein
MLDADVALVQSPVPFRAGRRLAVGAAEREEEPLSVRVQPTDVESRDTNIIFQRCGQVGKGHGELA